MVQDERAILGGVGLPAAQTDAVLRRKKSSTDKITFSDIYVR